LPARAIPRSGFVLGWFSAGPLSDGEDKNQTFVSWLDRAETGQAALPN